MVLALIVLIVLTRVSAPYGRHGRGGWGPPVPARWAWFGMEVMTLIGFGCCLLAAESLVWPSMVFLVLL